MSDHTFCRKLLSSIMPEVRKHVSEKDIKSSWAWESFGSYEFHGPNDFYTVCKGDCKWSAKADGWIRYLESLWIELEVEEEVSR